MADGFRRMRINTQERAISPDINRLQAFMHQDMAELFRYALDVNGNDDLTPGQVSEPNTVETPLRGEIFNGLLVKPQNGSLNLLVDPGVAFLMNPDSAPDESNYKYIRDPGVLVAGSLVMTNNATGSIRIDVIECRINPTEATVTDSRDIFNPTTGLFSAATVTKELRGRLEYRVRAGVAGSGMPANQAGWLPLCVASVPAGAVAVDTMTFWDVRPLVSGRAYGMHSFQRDEPIFVQGRMMNQAGASRHLQNGIVDLIDHNGRRLGGRLRTCIPAADDTSFSWDLADNYDTGAVGATNTNAFAYLATPFGLPTWARYTTTAPRLPRSPRGLVVLSSTIGPDARGKPSSALAMPPLTGLGSSTTSAVCFAQARRTGGGAGTCRGVQMSGLAQKYVAGITRDVAAGTAIASLCNFVPIPNDHFPQNAKAIYIDVHVERSVPDTVIEDMQDVTLSWDLLGSDTLEASRIYLPDASYLNNTGGAYLAKYESGTWRLEIPHEYPATTLTTPMRIQLIWGGTNPLTPDLAFMRIRGWDF